jgi:hypothetical protein
MRRVIKEKRERWTSNLVPSFFWIDDEKPFPFDLPIDDSSSLVGPRRK